MTWLSPLDFWQWAALTGLGLTFLGVVLAGVSLWLSARQTKAITGQIGATATLIAQGAERTETLIAGAEERTRTTLAQMDVGLKQVLDRIDARAEARYRDLKDRLEGEEGPRC